MPNDDSKQRTYTASLEHALLESVIATVPDALIVIDVRADIVSFSGAAQRMFQ